MRFSGPLLARLWWPQLGLAAASIAVLGNIQCHEILRCITRAVVVAAASIAVLRRIQGQCQKILRCCLGAVVVAANRVSRRKYRRLKEYTGTMSEDSWTLSWSGCSGRQ
jgi:hypothetical protein